MVKPPSAFWGTPRGLSSPPHPHDKPLKSLGGGGGGAPQVVVVFFDLRCGINSPAETGAGAALCAPGFLRGGGTHTQDMGEPRV